MWGSMIFRAMFWNIISSKIGSIFVQIFDGMREYHMEASWFNIICIVNWKYRTQNLVVWVFFDVPFLSQSAYWEAPCLIYSLIWCSSLIGCSLCLICWLLYLIYYMLIYMSINFWQLVLFSSFWQLVLFSDYALIGCMLLLWTASKEMYFKCWNCLRLNEIMITYYMRTAAHFSFV